MTRIALFSFGSRGDSEPMAALAQSLLKAGHTPRLVTGYAEHKGLGFDTRLWTDAFFLSRRFGQHQDQSRKAIVRRLFLHLPLLALGLVLAAIQVTTAAACAIPQNLRAADRQRERVRPWLDRRSLIDRVQLLDAMLRNHWRTKPPRSKSLIARWFGPLREMYPVPGRIVDFIDNALRDTDLVLIAEGADDPVRERLVLALCALHGIRCGSVTYFPRSFRQNEQALGWLSVSSFPFLLGWCATTPRVRSFTRLLSRGQVVLFTLAAAGYGQWYALFSRLLMPAPDLLHTVNEWCAAHKLSAITWDELFQADYDPALSFEAWDQALVPSTNAAGFWQLNTRDYEPPEQLRTFLCATNLPVLFVTRVARSSGIQALLSRALPNIGACRVIVNLPQAEAYSELASNPNVLFINDVPHSWLLPRVDAVIHHAGAGTTAAVLSAGVPSLSLPTWGDQSMWADIIFTKGLGVAPVHVRWLSDERLRCALRELLGDKDLQDRAASFGKSFSSKNPRASAITRLERVLARGTAPAPAPASPCHVGNAPSAQE